MIGWEIIILGINAILWYMRPLSPVGDFTLVATKEAVDNASNFTGIDLPGKGSGIKNAAECAEVARGYDNVVAMYQAPIYATGGYGESLKNLGTPGYCLAFKTIKGLSLKKGATNGQTVLARMGSSPPIDFA